MLDQTSLNASISSYAILGVLLFDESICMLVVMPWWARNGMATESPARRGVPVQVGLNTL